MIKKVLKRIYSVFKIIKYRKSSKIRISSIIIGNIFFEGKNIINYNNYIKNCNFGFGSYIGDNNHLIGVSIGRFCSIGSSVKVISSTHPSKSIVSTHPSFYRKNYGIFDDTCCFFDEKLQCSNEANVIIGNDVWICDNVLIKGGVTIGDGAIVAMGAVVVKNAPPYSIVGGVPAKVIGYRFDKEQINFLLNFKWWNKDINWINENISCFSDIHEFTKGAYK